MYSRLAALTVTSFFSLVVGVYGQIPKPSDAPQPLAAEESALRVKLPPGFRLELVASEPLIREPSGVCWDERGRLFVCELHGYNMEGQFDIEELNKTGKLDRVVRRLPANERARKAAEAVTNGTVKQLIDTDGDGRMDQAVVWADGLPPCFGICPARGGLIVVCAPDIVYLADRDDDGRAEVRERLFTGFPTGVLERRMSNPQWGLDDWIYIGRGQGGGRITGPYLRQPVDLPGSDFRIKADGSAIEPITGATHTIGITFTEIGERFVVSTRSPGIFVAPLPWRYLARNPDAAAASLEHRGASYQQVYPTSQPHPWRVKRASDPGFAKFYTDRYGIQESAPNGYFTSACSPLVYKDAALPGLRGHLLTCEPAQNLVHRAVLHRNGTAIDLRRAPAEERSEFLTSSDPWFHPIGLSHGPDGAVWVIDFYREIIEDYSAIPRYLQQQYGLAAGQNHGRIWRLVHDEMPAAAAPDMSQLPAADLAREVASSNFWRRQTARRLLVERGDPSAAQSLRSMLRPAPPVASEPAGVLNVLYALDGLAALGPEEVQAMLSHPRAGVRVHALRFAERWFDQRPSLLDRALQMADDREPIVLLQLALSLGEARDERVVPALAALSRKHGDLRWLNDAVRSSLYSRAGSMLAELLAPKGKAIGEETPADEKPGHAAALLEPLCTALAARRHPQELSDALTLVAACGDTAVQRACVRGLETQFRSAVAVTLSKDARQALKTLAAGADLEVRSKAQRLATLFKIESPSERRTRLTQAARDAGDVRLPLKRRLEAVEQLAAEDDPQVTSMLLVAFGRATPRVRTAVLDAVFSRSNHLHLVVDALEANRIPASALNAVQRVALLEHRDAALRARAEKALEPTANLDEKMVERFVAALRAPRDTARGEKVFRDKCASCHQAHGIGWAVGPDLTSEFRRAEETMVKDILAPGDVIAPGFTTYVIETVDGRIVNGLLVDESAGSVTLNQPDGKQETVLRKSIEKLDSLNVSLMPEELGRTLMPQDLADVIAWLRSPPSVRVLFDDDPSLVAALNEGEGTAALLMTDKLTGQASLRVTPPQRFSPRIAGWDFRIREHPEPGEFRYLRFAWKSVGAHGVMIELANQGKWPAADAPRFRYYAGRNTTGWQAREVSSEPPSEWTTVTRDLWKDFGDSTITGIAPTAMGGPALFDRIELLRESGSADISRESSSR